MYKNSFMKKEKLNLIVIVVSFIVINLLFNFRLVGELFSKNIALSDNIIIEYLVENTYQNLLHFKNPFITETIFYPFKVNYSLNDPANSYSILFFFLRSLLSPHKIMTSIVLLSFFLNNLLMYFFLKKLKISSNTSFLISLVFGFTPFLSQRVNGQYTYIAIFFFPCFYLILMKFFSSNNNTNKYFLSVLFAFLTAFLLLTNFYYLFSIVLSIFFFLVYFLYKNKTLVFKQLIKNIRYLFVSAVSLILFLLPWFYSVFLFTKNEKFVKTPGFGGAIDFSADLFSFFIPSRFNPMYYYLFDFLSKKSDLFYKLNTLFLKSWNYFVYPGVIIIFTYTLFIYLKIRKKLSKEFLLKVKPYFYSSLIFFILMLGPFLKIFNRWSINLDGVAVVVPLPFLLFHYVPFLSTLRVASRLAPIFVFFSSIVTAYVIDFFYNNAKRSTKWIIFPSLLLIFFMDQFYIIPKKNQQFIPYKIYKDLESKPEATVFEIPFTVRDGFQYIGFVHAISPMAGQIIHKKPIIGGYIARVNQKIFDYYENLPFINYVAKIIDKGNYNPLTGIPKEPNVFPWRYSLDVITREMKLLNVRYLILKNDEKYSSYLKSLFNQIGFLEKLKDGNYLLLELKI